VLINALAGSPEPLILVMDDYHAIRSKEIHASLNFLLDHLPQNVHLVLLSREDPPLGLARRRARRQMIEVRAADLRFRPDETGSFLQGVMGLDLDLQQIAALEERTEGWIAGLQMAGLSLQGRDPQEFLKSFAGVDHYIADYLVEEVLQRQPGGVRQFLLKTSVLEVLSAPLCAALLENTPLDLPGGAETLASPYSAMLDYLERANLFLVPLDNQREWFRYHHLFAQLLRQRLGQVYGADEKARLLRHASAWFETQGDPGRAIRHARQIPDYARVVELVEAHAGSFFLRSELLQFLEWVNEVPAGLYLAHPRLCMPAAWAALATNQFKAAGQWLEHIEKTLGYPAEAALNGEMLTPDVRAALLEVLLVRVRMDEEALPSPQIRRKLELMAQMLNGLPGEQACLFNTIALLRPVAAFNLGLSCEMAGDVQAAGKSFAEAAAFARQVFNSHVLLLALAHLANAQAANGHLLAARRVYQDALAESGLPGSSNSPFAALAHAGLGDLSYEWNDLPSAESSYQAALSLARPWQNWESLVPAVIGLSRVHSARGDDAAALRTLDDLALFFSDPGVRQSNYSLALALEAYQAVLLVKTGSRSQAAGWLLSSGLPTGAEPGLANEMALLDLARLLMLLDRPVPAVDLLENVMSSADAGGRQRAAIHARVLLARAEAAQGNLDQALLMLEEALRLAQAEGYRRVFLDEGETIHRLLNGLRSKLGLSDGLADYVRSTQTAFVPASQPGQATGVDLLSERELEILGLVAEGLTNQAIADRLVISLTTVKTHVGNIFLKLGVNNRTQAIARAETSGLLPRR
jgi:LuxR family transcriptional regulator, maltose regulon positive regulatory protein